MSSCPGYTLEAFLAWEYNIIVEDRPEANFSLGMAEAIGNIPSRPSLTKPQFAELVKMFEEYRHDVEARLDDFDEDEQSWRGYAGYAFEFIPEELNQQALAYVRSLNPPPAKENSVDTGPK